MANVVFTFNVTVDGKEIGSHYAGINDIALEEVHQSRLLRQSFQLLYLMAQDIFPAPDGVESAGAVFRHMEQLRADGELNPG